MSEIADYLESVGFTDYADGYKAKCYGTWGIYIFNVRESKLIDKHLLHGAVEYKVESVEDMKRIMEKKGL